MGKYTVELRELMMDSKTMEKLNAALSTYPLYVKKSEEKYIPSIVPNREELNKKLLNAYKYREIGFETVGRFIDELEIAMNEIMPYYNQLFFSADQDYNILFNVDYERTTITDRDGTTTGSSTSNGETNNTSSGTDSSNTTNTSSSNAKSIHSATPQNDLSITGANMDSVNYADDVNWSNSNGNDTTNTSGTSSTTGKTTISDTSSTTGTNKEKEETIERTLGNFGVMATQDLITKYRDLIINIEQQIINDDRISELFMRVF